MKPKIPQSILSGHENLCSELKDIIAAGGNIGEKAQMLDNVTSPHFEKEEKYAFPPLGFLLALSEGNWEIDATEAIKMAETLQEKLSELKIEHQNISRSLHELKIVAEAEDNPSAKLFVKDLQLHIEIEDQVLYPATILVGNYLKHIKPNL